MAAHQGTENMSVVDRVAEIPARQKFIVEEINETTAEVTYDPPDDRAASMRLHEVSAFLQDAGLEIDQVDMQQWTTGLRPGMSDGTRTPNRSRRITPSGPPRLIVRIP